MDGSIDPSVIAHSDHLFSLVEVFARNGAVFYWRLRRAATHVGFEYFSDKVL